MNGQLIIYGFFLAHLNACNVPTIKFGFITAKWCRSGSRRRVEFVSAGLLNIKRSRRPNMSNVSESWSHDHSVDDDKGSS